MDRTVVPYQAHEWVKGARGSKKTRLKHASQAHSPNRLRTIALETQVFGDVKSLHFFCAHRMRSLAFTIQQESTPMIQRYLRNAVLAICTTLIWLPADADRLPQRILCAEQIPGLGVDIQIVIHDETARGSGDVIPELLRPLCLAAYGALAMEPKEAAWVQNQLKVFVSDVVNGSNMNAANLGSHRIGIAATLLREAGKQSGQEATPEGLSRAREEVILFAMAHELGHAVLGHYAEISLSGLGLTATPAGVLGLAGLAHLFPRKGANRVARLGKAALLFGAAYWVVSKRCDWTQEATVIREYQADLFAVYALRAAGIPFNDVKNLSIRTLESNPEEATTCENKGEANVHPSTKDRVNSIRAAPVKRPGDLG